MSGVARGSWDDLVAAAGSPFQTTAFLDVVERCWPGEVEAHHVARRGSCGLDGALPLFLYGSCPRLDYYRREVTGLDPGDRLLYSHANIAWHGFPVGRSAADRGSVLEEAARLAEDRGAVLMLGGVDSRDREGVELARQAGFEVRQWHSLMVRRLDGLPDDPTAALAPRRRWRVRNYLTQGRRAGVQTRLARPGEEAALTRLLAGPGRHSPITPGVLTAEFMLAVLTAGLPGLDLVVATDPGDRPVGVHAGLHGNGRYLLWMAGHEAASLDRYRQSHVLYEACVARARALGCSEIQAGRAAYEVKFLHGYQPEALLAAVRGASRGQHERAAAWLRGLEARHLERYGTTLERHGRRQPPIPAAPR